ncbi:MAG: hypothetical protein HY907_20370 [Deltaproteobacteria bacterium]|nr:hypothetical protein [Deltaproteobacteria bacterium]
MKALTPRRAAWVAPLLALLLGCPASRARDGILPIRELELAEIRPGATLRVHGGGFVPGPVEVVFSGAVVQPGGSPEPWSFTVHASAVSDVAIAGLIPESSVEVLHGTHGRFRGELVVRFPPPGTPGLPPLSGRFAAVSLPMVSEAPAPRDVRTTWEASAERFLARLGLAVAVEQPDTPGASPRLVVRSLPAEPVPPLDELVPGDRIVALDGVPATALADLAPNEAAGRVTLTLAEKGTGRRYDVHLALQASEEGPPIAAALAVFVVLAVLGLVLAVHFAGVSDRLARLLVFPVLGRRAASAVPGAFPSRARPGRLGRLAAAAAVLACVAAPIALHRSGRELPVVWMWGVVVGLLLLHRLVHAVGDVWRARAGPAAGLGRAFAAVGAAGASALPLTASVALVLWSSAALTTGGAASAQGALPQEWAALRDPFALLLACLALGRLGTDFAPDQSGWRTAVDVLAAGAACLLLAVTGFGGWNAGAFEAVGFAGLPAGAWALVAKTALLLGAVVWHGRRRRGAPRAVGLLWLAAPPLALASAGIDALVPAPWVAAVARPVAAGLLGTLALALWLGNRRRTSPASVEIRVDAE